MKTFERLYSQGVLRQRWWIILFTPLLILATASGGRFLHFTNDYRVFFSAHNPELRAFEAMENTYTKDDNVLFVITPEGGDVFTADTLAAVEALTERAWQIPYSIRVDSITNFQHTYAEGDDLIVEDLVTGAGELSAEEIARVRDIALHEPLLAHRLVSPGGHVTAVNVTIQMPGVDEITEVPEVVAAARLLVNDILVEHPRLAIRLTGMVMMNNAFSEASMGDMQTLVPLSFTIMLLVLGLLLLGLTASFQRLSSGILAVVTAGTATLTTLLVILFSILAAMGLGGYIGFPITPPSASAPTIILTIALANSVHVLVTFFQEMRHGLGKKEAMAESVRINLQPLFLTSLTTAIGFLSMNFSDSPPFQHLGNFVAMGVAASFLLTISFLPALVSLLPVRVKPAAEGENTLMMRFGEFVVRRRQPLLWGMLTLVAALVVFIPQNELNDNFVNYFDESIAFRTDSDYTDQNLGGIYRIDYSLPAGETGGISEPGYLRQVEAFAQWWRQQPNVTHVNTLTDTMKRLNKNLHGDDPAWYRLPDSRGLAAQYLLLYEMSLPYGLDLNNQINVDKSSIRLSVTTRIVTSNDILAMEEKAQRWLEDNAPALAAPGTSTTVMFAHIGKRNIESMLVGTTLALVLISLILVAALRSVKIGLISMVPNLIPAAMGFGLWGLSVGEVGLALSVVTGMTLGIVVDDTVHFLSKYLRARRERNLSPPDAVRFAFRTVGTALWVTSVVLTLGFLVLALSAFELNAGMGLLTAIVIALALAADFLFLPPLLMKLEEKHHAKRIDAVAAAESA